MAAAPQLVRSRDALREVTVEKVLIVDDHPETIRLLELVLRTEGRQLHCAENGERALELARQLKPDVMLLDIMMPGALDGYQVARYLKSDPETSRIRIIVMTAKAQERDRQEVFAAGADDYITKPFDVVEVRRRVEKFLH